jgi:hypothetical protein
MKKQSFSDALIDLDSAFIDAEALGDAFDAAAGNDTPAWVYVYQCQMRTLRAAFDKLHKASQGLGGVGVEHPDGDEVDASTDDGRGGDAGMPSPALAP